MQKQIINRLLNGKMNTDSEKERVLPSDYIDALNITRSNKDTPYNLMGNTLVVNPYLHGTGDNKNWGHLRTLQGTGCMFLYGTVLVII